MIFTAPLMLLGLLAVAAPVVIHLLDRSRSKTLDWPALRFLQAARRESNRRSKLKNVLVLIARCLMLALVALAMAKPYTTHQEWTKPLDLPTTVVFVLDNSYSMGYREGGTTGGTRFDRAKAMALEQLAALKLEDEAALVLANEQAVVLLDRPTRDHEQVRKLIQEAKLSSRGTDLGSALVTAFAVARLDAVVTPAPGDSTPSATTAPAGATGRNAWRQLAVFTDLQQAGWASFINDKLIERVADPVPVTVYDLGSPDSTNRYVRQTTVQDGTLDDQLHVEVEVGRTGPSTAGGVDVTLWIDGKKAGAPTPVPPGLDKITLLAPMPAPGVHACSIEVEEDRLPADDRAHFSIRLTGGSRLLVVDGNPSSVPALSETFFLNSALSQLQSRVNAPTIQRLSLTDLASSDLGSGGCLILCNVARLDGSALNRVENFLRAGGSVFISLGDQVDIGHYNRDWLFLPLKLDKPMGDPARTRAYSAVVSADQHPIFLGGLDLSATRYFTFTGSDPTTLKSNARVLARFSNESPMLVEGAFGGDGNDPDNTAATGRVLLLTGAIDADASNFPYRRAFLPFIDQVVAYMTRQRLTSRSVALGRPMRFTGPGTLDRKTLVVTAPDGTTQTLTAALDGKSGHAVAEYRQTTLPGVYRVQADEGFGVGGAFTVNLDTRESLLTRSEPAEVLRAFGAVKARVLAAGAAAGDWARSDEARAAEQRTEYWPWLLLAAFLVFMAETALANIFTRRRAVPAPATQYLDATRRAAL
ncbi:MAG: BatA domain-containing protein [Planctomycetes bacterium]|nr:BatA domain-containing protein [Planctomycetota bacterium]